MSKRRGKIDVTSAKPALSGDLTIVKTIQVFNQKNKLKNLSEHTIKYYSENLNSVRKVLESFGVVMADEVTREVINNYIEGQINKGTSTVTINTKLRAIRALFNFLFKDGYISQNPVDGLELLKNTRNEIQTFSKQQINKLIKALDTTWFTGFRDYVIIMLMLETGVRVRELCDIRMRDVYLEDKFISVIGKNTERRNLPFQNKMKNILSQYIEIRGEIPGVSHLFITEDNTPITTRGVQECFKRLSKRVDIPDVRISPHTFRHTFAKMWIQNGGDTFSLQKILGHKSMDMVRIYVNMFDGDVQKAHEKFSPVERL